MKKNFKGFFFQEKIATGVILEAPFVSVLEEIELHPLARVII